MNLTKEQITEIDSKHIILKRGFSEESNLTTFQKILTEKFGQQPEDEFPKKGDMYFFNNGLGFAYDRMWEGGKGIEIDRKSIGNIYRTKEAAENRIALLKHIHEFKNPKPLEDCYILTERRDNLELTWTKTTKRDSCLENIYFFDGTLMPLSSTEEDRAERIRLLQLCFS